MNLLVIQVSLPGEKKADRPLASKVARAGLFHKGIRIPVCSPSKASNQEPCTPSLRSCRYSATLRSRRPLLYSAPCCSPACTRSFRLEVHVPFLYQSPRPVHVHLLGCSLIHRTT